jgi:hypothetical protein
MKTLLPLLMLACTVAFHCLPIMVVMVVAQTQTATPPNFNEHIAPIVFSKCAPCHREGEVAPFTLMSYQDVRRRSSLIKAVTQSGYMPPWKPVRGYGEFADARGLSVAEIALIGQWVDAGSPEGDATKTPKAPTFPSGSQLGTPDVVLKMPTPFRVKSLNKDEYRNFVIPTGLFENKVVRAIEFRPGNPKVVHHALLALDTNGSGRKLDAEDTELGYAGGGGAGFLPAENYTGWVPGAQTRFLPPSFGISMDKNSDLIFQVHYAPSMTEAMDQSSVNVYFVKDTTNLRLLSRIQPMNPSDLTGSVLTGFASFLIPANQQRKFVARRRIRQDLSLISIAPHQHLLGRTTKAYAVTAQRDTIPLVNVTDWDFQWQGSYSFRRLLKIPAGSEIVYETSYDNTTNNFRNPNNPPISVRWGERTGDEMMLCYFLGLPYKAGDENISLETALPSITMTTSVRNDPNSAYPISDVEMSLSPNPAVSSVGAVFSLPERGVATLDVVSSRGERVLTVFAGTMLAAGAHTFTFDAAQLAGGVYFCRLTVQGRSFVQPLVVAR